MQYTERMEWLTRVQDKLDRRFNAGDMADHLDKVVPVIDDFLDRYDGSFAFLLDMQRQRFVDGRELSTRQLAGVANCLAVDVKRHLEQEARVQEEAAAEPSIDGPISIPPNGIYTVVFDEDTDDRITIRFEKPIKQYLLNKGASVVGYLYGSDNESDYRRFGYVAPGHGLVVYGDRDGDHLERPKRAVSILLASDPDTHAEAMHQYALASGRCARCNRTLTVPASVHRGLGPDCARLLGM